MPVAMAVRVTTCGWCGSSLAGRESSCASRARSCAAASRNVWTAASPGSKPRRPLDAGGVPPGRIATNPARSRHPCVTEPRIPLVMGRSIVPPRGLRRARSPTSSRPAPSRPVQESPCPPCVPEVRGQRGSARSRTMSIDVERRKPAKGRAAFEARAQRLVGLRLAAVRYVAGVNSLGHERRTEYDLLDFGVELVGDDGRSVYVASEFGDFNLVILDRAPEGRSVTELAAD